MQVVDALGRIGKVEEAAALVKPILGAADPFRYRNKMAFTFAPQVLQSQPLGLPRPAGFGLRKISNPNEVLPLLSLVPVLYPALVHALCSCRILTSH